jgi:hypothetical protein
VVFRETDNRKRRMMDRSDDANEKVEVEIFSWWGGLLLPYVLQTADDNNYTRYEMVRSS